MNADRTNRILRTGGHTHLASFCLFANFLQLDLLLFPRFLQEIERTSERNDRQISIRSNKQTHTTVCKSDRRTYCTFIQICAEKFDLNISILRMTQESEQRKIGQVSSYLGCLSLSLKTIFQFVDFSILYCLNLCYHNLFTAIHSQISEHSIEVGKYKQ